MTRSEMTVRILLILLLGQGAAVAGAPENLSGGAFHPAVSLTTTPQESVARQENQTPPSIVRSIFDDIQRGIGRGDPGLFLRHFARQVSIYVRGGESGYYSANQAYYILKSFFDSRRILGFRFSTVFDPGEHAPKPGEALTDEPESAPYATGGGTFLMKGGREPFQVYVAISKIDGRWLVTQFNVY